MTDDVVQSVSLGEVKKQPKIVGYMSALYDKMSSTAEPVTTERQETILVWQGRIIETCTSIGIPEGYYKKVVDALRTIGCIEVLSRGKRGASLTTIVLRFPPTAELYEGAIVKSGWQGLTTAPSLDTLAAQVRDVLKQIGGLHIVDAFKNHEDRIAKLETAVRDLQQQLSSVTNSNTNQ